MKSTFRNGIIIKRKNILLAFKSILISTEKQAMIVLLKRVSQSYFTTFKDMISRLVPITVLSPKPTLSDHPYIDLSHFRLTVISGLKYLNKIIANKEQTKHNISKLRCSILIRQKIISITITLGAFKYINNFG